MNAMNNFTISGFVVNDAKVKNFEKASVARFGLSFRTTEKKGDQEVKKSSILDMETWIKKDDTATIDMLKRAPLSRLRDSLRLIPIPRMARRFIKQSLLLQNRTHRDQGSKGGIKPPFIYSNFQ